MRYSTPPGSGSRRCRSSRTGSGRHCMRNSASRDVSIATSSAATQWGWAAKRSGDRAGRMNELSPPDGALDLPMRLVGRQEHVVVVVEPEGRQIHQDVV